MLVLQKLSVEPGDEYLPLQAGIRPISRSCRSTYRATNSVHERSSMSNNCNMWPKSSKLCLHKGGAWYGGAISIRKFDCDELDSQVWILPAPSSIRELRYCTCVKFSTTPQLTCSPSVSKVTFDLYCASRLCGGQIRLYTPVLEMLFRRRKSVKTISFATSL